MNLKYGASIAAMLISGVITSQAQSLTRGIGIYPGLPEECFAPTVIPDESGTIRDVALHRRAMASSQADYNRTAQWITHNGDSINNWRSLTGGRQWVTVDLGAPATIDQLIIGWLDRPATARLALSDDGQHWTDALTNAKSDTITPEKAITTRYLRIDMDGRPERPYSISRIQAIGRGGATVVPHPRDSKPGSLNGGDWRVIPSRDIPHATGQQVSLGNFESAPWITATVPGTVLMSYVNNGAVPDPNHITDELQISENYFDTDFWYYTQFPSPKAKAGAHQFLEFDGVNWKGEVWLNGKHLGRIDGAFRRGQYDITSLLRHNGLNHLAIKILKNATPGDTHTKTLESTGPNGGKLGADNPTFHASVGWDWITTVRGRNIGIWNDVRITQRGSVALADPIVDTRLALPDTAATITPSVVVTNFGRHRTKVTVKCKIGTEIEVSRTLTLQPGADSLVTFSPTEYPVLADRRMPLWWPAGYGPQALHESSFTAIVNGDISDRIDFNTGVRQLTYDDSNGILNIYINGRRFVGRGGNWGFPEHNLAYRGREYDIAVGNHARMNCTMIRNWVGQTGDEEFYDACDRHGVMIWQDFWLANPGDGPNPDNEDMFMDNARDYVKKIRRHPSIALYCGRNEGNPPATLDSALRATVDQLHPGMHYISHSAAGTVSGFGPYGALRPREYFGLRGGIDRLHSERGMPNVMTPEGTRRALGDNAAWPIDQAWAQRDFTYGGAQSGRSFITLTANALGQPTSADEFARRAQLTNYDGYRAMYEARSPYRQGLLIWMSHPAEPSMVWQTYDYYFEPTAGFFGVKKACEPLHIQWNQHTDSIEVVNISAGNRNRLQACIDIFDVTGKPVSSNKTVINSAEDTTIPVGKRPAEADSATPVQFIRLTLCDASGTPISRNVYIRGREEGNYQALRDMPVARPELTSWTISANADGSYSGHATVRNSSAQPALLVRLNLVGDDGDQILPVNYSDNYITLMPGESVNVDVDWMSRDARGSKSPKIVLSTVLD